METNCFSHLLPNLFIGLSKGAYQLRPYSKEFKQLGYRVFKFEPFFPISAGQKTNPDMVIISERLGNTVMIEWTEVNSVREDKREQLHRYSKVTKRDLTNVLAIPPVAVETFDVCVIISPEAVDSFEGFFKKSNLQFPLLKFGEMKDGFYLMKVLYEFEENQTNTFFSRPMNLSRIPRRYLPFALDEILHRQLVTHIVRHLLSLVRKETKEFTIDEFCSGYVPVWSLVDIRKQGEVKRVTKEVLVKLLSKPIGKELLKRLKQQPPTWEIIDEFDRRRSMRLIGKSLQEFIAEVKGKEFQLELDY